MTVDGHVE
jgi:hypothetical protein